MVTPVVIKRYVPLFLALCLMVPLTALAQETEDLSVKVEPAELTLKIGGCNHGAARSVWSAQ